MRVEVYSDVVCPWCYIGERRFGTALERAGIEDVEVVYRPYQLDPAAPAEGIPLTQYLEGRFGPGAAAMQDRVSDAAAEEGVAIDWKAAIAANTFDAHRLLWLADSEGDAGTQRALAEYLFAAHFTRGLDVSDHDVLADLAAETGLDRDRAAAFLASEDGARQVREGIDAAQRMGIRAVPSFVLDGKYLVQGAQPADTFVEVLRQV